MQFCKSLYQALLHVLNSHLCLGGKFSVFPIETSLSTTAKKSPLFLSILDSFVSATLSFDAAPPVANNSDRGWLVGRGTNITIKCNVASVTKPTIVLQKDRIIVPVEQLVEQRDPASTGTYLWQVLFQIYSFQDNDAAKYICGIATNESVLSRTSSLNIQGIITFKRVSV